MAPLNENASAENYMAEDNTMLTDPAQEVGRTLDAARVKVGEKIEPVGE